MLCIRFMDNTGTIGSTTGIGDVFGSCIIGFDRTGCFVGRVLCYRPDDRKLIAFQLQVLQCIHLHYESSIKLVERTLATIKPLQRDCIRQMHGYIHGCDVNTG